MSVFSVKEAFQDLTSLAPQLPRLAKEHPQYNEIIKVIGRVSKESGFPTLKSVQEETGKTSSELRKQIRELYWLVTEEEGFLEFRTVEYNLHFRVDQKIYLVEKGYHKITLDHLAVVPRIGDPFNVSFLRSAVGITHFFVKRVMYSLKGDKQVIDISLSTEKQPEQS